MDKSNSQQSSIQPPKQTNNLSWLKTLYYGFAIVSFGIAIAVIGYILTAKK